MNTPAEHRTLTLDDARLQAWQQCWPASVAGFSVQVCITVTASGGDSIILGASAQVGPLGPYVWSFPINGSFACDIAIVSGVSLQLTVSQWTIDQSDISFMLKVKVCALMCVTLYSNQVTVPLTGIQTPAGLTGLQLRSPRDLADLLAQIPSAGDDARGGSRGPACRPGCCHRD